MMNFADTQTLAAIEAAWNSDKTRQEIIDEFGISYSTLQRLAKSDGWRHKPLPPKKENDEKNGPGPQEIAARAAEVRSWWSEEEKEKRRVGPKRQARVPRQYVFNRNTQTLESIE